MLIPPRFNISLFMLNTIWFHLCFVLLVCVSICMTVRVCMHWQHFLLPISHDTAVLSLPHLLLGGFQLDNNVL